MLSHVEILLTILVLTGLFGSVSLQWFLNGMALTIPHVRQFFWHKALTVFAAGVLFLSVVVIAVSLVSAFILILIVVMSIALVDAVICFRRAEYRSLHGAVHGMLSQRLSLPLALRQYAAERRDGIGRRAAIVAERVESGEPPEMALQQLVSANDLETTLALRLVPETQDLAAPFEPRPESYLNFDRSAVEIQNLLLYLGFLAIASGYLIFHAGSVIRGLKDEALPDDYVTTFGWLPLESLAFLPAMMFGLALLIFVAWLLFVTGGFRGSFPLSSYWNRLLDRARVLETLALTIQRNCPMAETLNVLVNVYPRKEVGRRIRQVLVRMSQGEESWRVLREAGFVRKDEQRLLAASEKTGNLPWVLREVAYRNRRRHVQRMKRLVHALAVATLLTIGMATLIATVELFGMLAVFLHHGAIPDVA